MYDTYMQIVFMVGIILVAIWVIYVGSSIQNHKERLIRLEKRINQMGGN